MPQPVTSSLRGHLLLSAPHVRGDLFENTTIFLCSHDTEGAVGIIVNRPLETITFLELLNQFHIKTPAPMEHQPVFFGGPVEINRGFILHPTSTMLESSIAVNTDIALTANLNFFRENAAASNPKEVLVALGYAGWQSGQLETELKNGHWLTIPATKELLFEKSPAEKWPIAYKTLGINPAFFSHKTGTA